MRISLISLLFLCSMPALAMEPGQKETKTVPSEMVEINEWEELGQFAGHFVAYDATYSDNSSPYSDLIEDFEYARFFRLNKAQEIRYGYIAKNIITWSHSATCHLDGYSMHRLFTAKSEFTTCPLDKATFYPKGHSIRLFMRCTTSEEKNKILRVIHSGNAEFERMSKIENESNS